MATVKIKSNPYERKIEFLSYKEQTGEWEEIQRGNPEVSYVKMNQINVSCLLRSRKLWI